MPDCKAISATAALLFDVFVSAAYGHLTSVVDMMKRPIGLPLQSERQAPLTSDRITPLLSIHPIITPSLWVQNLDSPR